MPPCRILIWKPRIVRYYRHAVPVDLLLYLQCIFRCSLAHIVRYAPVLRLWKTFARMYLDSKFTTCINHTLPSVLLFLTALPRPSDWLDLQPPPTRDGPLVEIIDLKVER